MGKKRRNVLISHMYGVVSQIGQFRKLVMSYNFSGRPGAIPVLFLLS